MFKLNYTPLHSFTRLEARTGFKKSFAPTLKRSTMKIKSKATPKKELDAIISKIVRISAADSNGYVQCATCPTLRHWKEMQCGHYRKREHMATRFDLHNLAPQCEDCNVGRQGETEKLREYLVCRDGEKSVREVEMKSETIMPGIFYENEVVKWRGILSELVERKGLAEIKI